jgi:hypothetical protein
LRKAEVSTELEHVIAAYIARVVQKLVNVRDAVLRIVAFIAEREKP